VRRVVLALTILFGAGAAPAMEIAFVRHEPATFDPRRGESARILFRLSDPAQVTLSIYDARDLRVCEIGTKEILSAGDHELRWDGRDAHGHPVPPEAYAYTLEAQPRSGAAVRWDLSDATGGERTIPEDVRWNPDTGRVSYRIREPSRVRIRIGLLVSGPLLQTLIDWVPRAAGSHTEHWDGRDRSGVLSLAKHPSLYVQAEGFALSQNTLVVGPPAAAVALIPSLGDDAARRPSHREGRPGRLFDFASQPIEQRRDFDARVALPRELEHTAKGLPIVDRTTPVRVEISEFDLARMLNERSEVVFYLDGQSVFENEAAFLPMTWRWNPDGVNEGVHSLTVNLRGYDGHIGVGTVQVYVRKAKEER